MDERRPIGWLTPPLPLLTPPIGPSNDEDTDLPHATIFPVPSRARKNRFSAFPDERIHPLLVHLVDQTLLSPPDHPTTPLAIPLRFATEFGSYNPRPPTPGPAGSTHRSKQSPPTAVPEATTPTSLFTHSRQGSLPSRTPFSSQSHFSVATDLNLASSHRAPSFRSHSIRSINTMFYTTQPPPPPGDTPSNV